MSPEGHEALGEHADGVLTAARLGAKRSVDAASSGTVASVAFVGGCSGDEAGESVEPEAAIERALGEQRAIDEHVEDLAGRTLGGQQSVVFALQALECEVAGLSSQPKERFCDELTFVLFVDVAYDAEQVSRVGAVGERARALLALEDRDPGDDRVERIARDCQAYVPLGVEECESLEGCIEKGSHIGALTRFECLSRELLTPPSVFEGAACSGDLLIGGLDGVELGP